MTDRIGSLVTEWTRAKAGAVEFIEAMPEELIGYKPVPEVFSFAGQMVHIASVNYIFAAGAGAMENPFDKAKGNDPEKNEELQRSKPALLEFVSGSYDFIIRAVQTLSPEALDESIQFHKWVMTRGVILAKAMEHHAHHRGQTVVYFRQNGLKPPAERLF